MAIIKCKMCGGDLEIAAGVTVAECEFCGTKQTLPKANDEVVQNLFNRANNLRIKCEFDKAEQIYEKILQENDTEAEAHWGIVLCKYGIEYVEDPKTYKRIPTCHRTSYDAVITDADYLAAVEHADAVQRSIYEAEAKAIDEIQKNILNIVKNEKPFDVFICYKESDENGKRTVDSVIANDIYHQLTQEGLKVFYAAITLEDKLGQAYEPYIFAALNSAKVMLVIGTKPQYFSAVWVKNEWSRFLKLMKADHSKLLIPCYKEMDAYDLPEEFSHLQAQDMSKIGFINDIVRGIKKVTVKDEPKAAAVQEAAPAANANTAPLLKRAFMFLEDGDWESAEGYCEKVLDLDPECAEAYVGKLMAELQVKKQNVLKDCAEPFDGNNNYQKAIRFANEELKTTLAGYIEHINTRNENARLEYIYTEATKLLDKAQNKQECDLAADKFKQIPGYKDADALVAKCMEKAENIKKENIYREAKRPISESSRLVSIYENSIAKFQEIPGYKDADELVAFCQKKIEQLKEEEEKERQLEELRAKRYKKILIIIAPIACVIIAFLIILSTVIIPNGKYKDAVALMDAGKYSEAIYAFKALDGYKDSTNRITECITAILDDKYNDAIALMDAGKYTEAISAFQAINGYKDSESKIAECHTAILDSKYNDAVAAEKSGDLRQAAMLYRKLGEYRDASEKAMTLWEQIAVRETISADSSHTVGLKTDSTVMAAGRNGEGQCYVSAWQDIVAISAGSNHTVGLKKDGTVVAVGYMEYNQCNVTGWRDIVAISAGSNHTVGLKMDGTVVAVGSNISSQCDVADWRDIVAISAGSNHTVGLKMDGTVVAVGSNISSQCDVADWRDIVAISAGGSHTVGLKKDGTVVAVGDNTSNQCNVADWRDIVAISAGFFHTVGLKKDGTAVAVGHNYSNQCNVDNWRDIVAISAGGSHTVGLKEDGTVVTVGWNDDSQCNVGDWTNIKVPGN